MTDRILSRCLWLLVMGLIAGSALGGLVLMYSGLFKLISQQFESGAVIAFSGILLGSGCWILCKHSDDLIDRQFASVASRCAQRQELRRVIEREDVVVWRMGGR
jgi:hypothetical protein